MEASTIQTPTSKTNKLRHDFRQSLNPSQYPLNDSSCKDYMSCPCINRLLSALKYYSSLNPRQNADHREMLTRFINEKYDIISLINDFNHFQKTHGSQLHDIMNYVVDEGKVLECNIDTCHFANRHYRITDQQHSMTGDVNLIDLNINLFCDTLDSFHYYLLHLFQAGFRVADGKYDSEGSSGPDIETYDSEFARIAKAISSTREATIRFSRISSTKYSISANCDEIKDDKDETDGITYLDSVFSHLEQIGIESSIITKLYVYLRHERYDTESMYNDINMNGGNIARHMENNSICMEGVKDIFNQSLRMSQSVYLILFRLV